MVNCVASLQFSELVNGTSTGFQMLSWLGTGTLSLLLSVMMEALSKMMFATVNESFLLAIFLGYRMGGEISISHFLFVGETLLLLFL